MKTLTQQFQEIIDEYFISSNSNRQDAAVRLLILAVKERDMRVVGASGEVKESYPLHKKSMVMQQNELRKEIRSRQKKTL